MASTTTQLQQRKKKAPSAPTDLIEFFQAALFLDDPDLPKEQRTSLAKFIGIVFAVVAYVTAVFALIILACIVTPLVPALRHIFSTTLRLLAPPESWFKSAYEYQAPLVRLTRFISSHVMSILNRRASTVACEMPALHRLVSRSSYAATM